MIFLVFKIGLTTLTAQAVFIQREKMWKVVINLILLYIQLSLPFSKYVFFFEIVTFYLTLH